MNSSLLALAALLTLCACGPSALSRDQGPAFGHFAVTAQSAALASLEPPLAVSVGGLAAYDVQRLADDRVTFTVQGHPQAGPQPVVVSARGQQVALGSLDYTAPAHPALARVVAFGASLTMGTQDATITTRTQLHGPATLFARQAGVYLGLPLLKEGFLPTLGLDDFDLATCTERGDLFEALGQRALNDLMPRLKDRDGNVVIGRLRVDPALEVTNVAIGGMRVTEVVNHAPSLFGTVLEHVVWDVDVDTAQLISSPPESMLDRVVALEPTLVLSTDLIGNDYNNVSVNVDGIPSLDAVTSEADFTAALRTVLARLDATGAQVFLATGPDATLLPRYDVKVAQLRAQGFSEAQATGWRDELRARIGRFNELLLAEAAPSPRVHVIDLAPKVKAVFEDGVDVGGTHLSAAPFGGLLSLDSMHFSDTGYAVLANLFIDEVNAQLGTDIPRADLAAIHAEDPYAVQALRASGYTCAGR